MAEHSSIEWTDATWNPITGCSVVSPGCTNCYAMKLAGTRLRHLPSRQGLTVETKAGPVWNGKVRLIEEKLVEPLRWRRGRRIFVCAHGDLFHESVPDEWIDRVFAVMALAPHHTFQVLTKRAARMRSYCARTDERGRHPSMITAALMAATGRWNTPALDLRRWPLSNVWLGVSAEDQRRADERVPDLLATPAAVRFVSAEPLLGPIDFTRIEAAKKTDAEGRTTVHPKRIDSFTGRAGHYPSPTIFYPNSHGVGARLDWIIVGGESGPGARPMHPTWARQIRDACAGAGVAYLFKQWGAWAPEARGNEWMILSAGGDLDIPDDRWPDEEAGEAAVTRVGKKAAGRLLDGAEHNGFPEVAR